MTAGTEAEAGERDEAERAAAVRAEQNSPRLRAARRRIIAIFGLESVGTGAFTSAQILFFTESLHRTPSQISLALSLAGLVVFGVILPFGKAADKRDNRNLVVALNLATGLALLGYFLPSSLPVFFGTTALVTVLQRMLGTSRAALLAQTFPATRTMVRASMYVAYNVGFSVGSLGAAWAVQQGSRHSYRILLAADALCFVLCAVFAVRLPSRPPSTAGPDVKRGYAVLRDRPFVIASLTNTFGALHDSALFVGLPLWLLHRTDAPRWVIPAMTIVNSALVVLLQGRLSRGTDTVRGAARTQRRGTLALGAACLAVTFTAGRFGPLEWALLAGGVTLFTVSEIVQQAGAWGLSYSLADDNRTTEYQAVFGLSLNLQEIAGPVLVTALVLGLPSGLSWMVLGAIVLVPVLSGTRLLLRARPGDPTVRQW